MKRKNSLQKDMNKTENKREEDEDMNCSDEGQDDESKQEDIPKQTQSDHSKSKNDIEMTISEKSPAKQNQRDHKEEQTGNSKPQTPKIEPFDHRKPPRGGPESHPLHNVYTPLPAIHSNKKIFLIQYGQEPILDSENPQQEFGAAPRDKSASSLHRNRKEKDQFFIIKNAVKGEPTLESQVEAKQRAHSTDMKVECKNSDNNQRKRSEIYQDIQPQGIKIRDNFLELNDFKQVSNSKITSKILFGTDQANNQKQNAITDGVQPPKKQSRGASQNQRNQKTQPQDEKITTDGILGLQDPSQSPSDKKTQELLTGEQSSAKEKPIDQKLKNKTPVTNEKLPDFQDISKIQNNPKKRSSLLTSRAKKTLVVQQNVDKKGKDKIKISKFDPDSYNEKSFKEQETKADQKQDCTVSERSTSSKIGNPTKRQKLNEGGEAVEKITSQFEINHEQREKQDKSILEDSKSVIENNSVKVSKSKNQNQDSKVEEKSINQVSNKNKKQNKPEQSKITSKKCCKKTSKPVQTGPQIKAGAVRTGQNQYTKARQLELQQQGNQTLSQQAIPSKSANSKSNTKIQNTQTSIKKKTCSKPTKTTSQEKDTGKQSTSKNISRVLRSKSGQTQEQKSCQQKINDVVNSKNKNNNSKILLQKRSNSNDLNNQSQKKGISNAKLEKTDLSVVQQKTPPQKVNNAQSSIDVHKGSKQKPSQSRSKTSKTAPLNQSQSQSKQNQSKSKNSKKQVTKTNNSKSAKDNQILTDREATRVAMGLRFKPEINYDIDNKNPEDEQMREEQPNKCSQDIEYSDRNISENQDEDGEDEEDESRNLILDNSDRMAGNMTLRSRSVLVPTNGIQIHDNQEDKDKTTSRDTKSKHKSNQDKKENKPDQDNTNQLNKVKIWQIMEILEKYKPIVLNKDVQQANHDDQDKLKSKNSKVTKGSKIQKQVEQVLGNTEKGHANQGGTDSGGTGSPPMSDQDKSMTELFKQFEISTPLTQQQLDHAWVTTQKAFVLKFDFDQHLEQSFDFLQKFVSETTQTDNKSKEKYNKPSSEDEIKTPEPDQINIRSDPLFFQNEQNDSNYLPRSFINKKIYHSRQPEHISRRTPGAPDLNYQQTHFQNLISEEPQTNEVDENYNSLHIPINNFKNSNMIIDEHQSENFHPRMIDSFNYPQSLQQNQSRRQNENLQYSQGDHFRESSYGQNHPIQLQQQWHENQLKSIIKQPQSHDYNENQLQNQYLAWQQDHLAYYNQNRGVGQQHKNQGYSRETSPGLIGTPIYENISQQRNKRIGKIFTETIQPINSGPHDKIQMIKQNEDRRIIPNFTQKYSLSQEGQFERVNPNETLDNLIDDQTKTYERKTQNDIRNRSQKLAQNDEVISSGQEQFVPLKDEKTRWDKQKAQEQGLRTPGQITQSRQRRGQPPERTILKEIYDGRNERPEEGRKKSGEFASPISIKRQSNKYQFRFGSRVPIQGQSNERHYFSAYKTSSGLRQLKSEQRTGQQQCSKLFVSGSKPQSNNNPRREAMYLCHQDGYSKGPFSSKIDMDFEQTEIFHANPQFDQKQRIQERFYEMPIPYKTRRIEDFVPQEMYEPNYYHWNHSRQQEMPQRFDYDRYGQYRYPENEWRRDGQKNSQSSFSQQAIIDQFDIENNKSELIMKYQQIDQPSLTQQPQGQLRHFRMIPPNEEEVFERPDRFEDSEMPRYQQKISKQDPYYQYQQFEDHVYLQPNYSDHRRSRGHLDEGDRYLMRGDKFYTQLSSSHVWGNSSQGLTAANPASSEQKPNEFIGQKEFYAEKKRSNLDKPAEGEVANEVGMKDTMWQRSNSSHYPTELSVVRVQAQQHPFDQKQDRTKQVAQKIPNPAQTVSNTNSSGPSVQNNQQ